MIVKEIKEKQYKKDKTINVPAEINTRLNEQLKEHEFLIKLRQSLVIDENQEFEVNNQVRDSRNSVASQRSLRK